MAHQLVGKRARYTRDVERHARVLRDRPVPLLEQGSIQILVGRARRRVRAVERLVAGATRELGE
ncbi:hypothetical protein QP277_26015, partial [Escherichia coli]|nr:hypothetical protein [Escherichia coli]